MYLHSNIKIRDVRKEHNICDAQVILQINMKLTTRQLKNKKKTKNRRMKDEGRNTSV